MTNDELRALAGKLRKLQAGEAYEAADYLLACADAKPVAVPAGWKLVPVEPTEEWLEVGRKAIEDALVEWRDERLSEPNRANGCVIRERDGTPSNVIRFGPETALRIGYKAMLAAAPAAPQAEPPQWTKNEDGSWSTAPFVFPADITIIVDGKAEQQIPQAEPKREPLSDESPKVEWLSTDDAETQLALAIRDAVKVAPSADDKALLYALNRRGIWLAWIGGSDAE